MERLGNFYCPTPSPLLSFDRRSPPWNKFLSYPSLPLPWKSKMAATAFNEKRLGTRSPKLRLLCRLMMRGNFCKCEQALFDLTTQIILVLLVSESHGHCKVLKDYGTYCNESQIRWIVEPFSPKFHYVFVCLISLQAGRYGQLTYLRVYQGLLKRGAYIVNTRTGKRLKVPRIVRMHSDTMEVTEKYDDMKILSSFLYSNDAIKENRLTNSD